MKKFATKTSNLLKTKKVLFNKSFKMLDNSIEKELASENTFSIERELALEKIKNEKLQKQIDSRNEREKENSKAWLFSLKFFGSIYVLIYILLPLIGLFVKGRD